jgi:Flp pilus assembly protein TadD
MKTTVLLVAATLVAGCNRSPETSAQSSAAPLAELPISSTSPEAIQAFRHGRELLENARASDARADFQRAVRLDPKFAQAHVLLAAVSRGPMRALHARQASAFLSALPETERLYIEMLLARQKNDRTRAQTLLVRLSELLPRDWRIQVQLGGKAFAEKDWNGVIRAMRQASALNPKAGEPYNQLAYAFAFQRRFEDAIAAIDKYAALKPSDPNPLDSKGEILLMAGRFPEADAAFRRAADITPTFWLALEGAAIARFLDGDWTGGRERLAHARTAAAQPIDKLWLDVTLAKSYEAQGNTAEALRILDAMEKEAQAQSLEVRRLWAPFHRAVVLHSAARHEDALRELDVAFERAKSATVSTHQAQDLRIRGNLARLRLLAALKRSADAEKTFAALDAELQAVPAARYAIHGARGALALANGDRNAALQHFGEAPADDLDAKEQLLRLQEASGDSTAAAKTRELVLKSPKRNMGYVSVRTRISAK